MGGKVVATESTDASEPSIKYEAMIAGRKVTFKQLLPLGEARNLLSLIRTRNEDDLTTCVPLCCVLIESWEFDGDPHDPTAYEKLDAFAVLGIVTASDAHAQQRVAGLIGTSPKV